MKNKKGQLVLYIYFIVIAIIIVFVAAIVAPLGIMVNTQMILAGQDVLKQANESIQNISDPAMKAHIMDAVNTGFDNGQNNIDVLSAIFQYSWVIVLIITCLIFFMLSRRLVEYGGGIA
jgi:hypothetical protein